VNDDDLAIRLREAVRAEVTATRPHHDIVGVVRKGKQLRWRKWGSAALAVIVLAGAGWAVGYELTSDQATRPVGREDGNSRFTETDEMQTDPPEIDEPTERAVVHAIRALVQADLFDLLGDHYGYRRAATMDDGWVVAFRRGKCDMSTCRPVPGVDGTARLLIAERDGSLVVADAQGSFDDNKREQVVGFSLPIIDEPPHWEWSVSVGDRFDGDSGSAIYASQYWVGPIPTEMPGSRCELKGFDSDGDLLFEDHPYWQNGPRFGEAGRASGGLIMEHSAEPASATFECAPFEGVGWQPIGKARIRKTDDYVYVTSSLVWRDEGLVHGRSHCNATVYDRSGNRIKRVGSPVDRFWPPRTVEKGPPYSTEWSRPFRMKHPQRAKRATVECRLG
jgi:hypothetical protein